MFAAATERKLGNVGSNFMKKTVNYIFIFLVSMRIQAQNAETILMKSYEQNSKKELKIFFDTWNKKHQTITENELLKKNDTIKNVYNSFTIFYNPLQIKKLGGSEWGNNIYKKSKYLIVQNKIFICFSNKIYYTEKEIDEYAVKYINRIIKDKEKRDKFLERKDGKLSDYVLDNFSPYKDYNIKQNEIITDSIINFNPKINCKNKVPVYLTADYDKMLNIFLGNDEIPFGNENIIQPAKSKDESEKRKSFLENFIKIYKGHWGGYWQLYSYPIVSRIVFDKKMEYARIDFRMIYQGGEAILKNENGEWKLIESKITWIE